MEREGRIERVPDRLFEGEEPVLHLMGDQIRETKRRIAPDPTLAIHVAANGASRGAERSVATRDETPHDAPSERERSKINEAPVGPLVSRSRRNCHKERPGGAQTLWARHERGKPPCKRTVLPHQLRFRRVRSRHKARQLSEATFASRDTSPRRLLVADSLVWSVPSGARSPRQGVIPWRRARRSFTPRSSSPPFLFAAMQEVLTTGRTRATLGTG
jgi:hypothetical protein